MLLSLQLSQLTLTCYWIYEPADLRKPAKKMWDIATIRTKPPCVEFSVHSLKDRFGKNGGEKTLKMKSLSYSIHG